jgi:hypothetical protein
MTRKVFAIPSYCSRLGCPNEAVVARAGQGQIVYWCDEHDPQRDTRYPPIPRKILNDQYVECVDPECEGRMMHPWSKAGKHYHYCGG